MANVITYLSPERILPPPPTLLQHFLCKTRRIWGRSLISSHAAFLQKILKSKLRVPHSAPRSSLKSICPSLVCLHSECLGVQLEEKQKKKKKKGIFFPVCPSFPAGNPVAQEDFPRSMFAALIELGVGN